jgi:hypothetical protein
MAASAISDETFAAPEPAIHVKRMRSRPAAAESACQRAAAAPSGSSATSSARPASAISRPVT